MASILPRPRANRSQYARLRLWHLPSVALLHSSTHAVVAEIALLLVVLVAALWMRPWQLMRSGTRLGPLLGALTLLPWLWALPRVMKMPLQRQLSGACAVTLLLGWPLAVPVLVLAALLATFIAPIPFAEAVSLALWLGVAPAIFVAYKPQWLATWSDRLYLQKP